MAGDFHRYGIKRTDAAFSVHIVFEGDAPEKDKYILSVYTFYIAGELHLHIHRIIIQIILNLVHPFRFTQTG